MGAVVGCRALKQASSVLQLFGLQACWSVKHVCECVLWGGEQLFPGSCVCVYVRVWTGGQLFPVTSRQKVCLLTFELLLSGVRGFVVGVCVQ
jgi:hypothetical protein